MYRLMIIDDEPIVRAGIRKLLPWSKYNFEICAEGVDGKDGLNKIIEYSPDLVLVDVKIPGMNGLELIREARKRDFDGKFIILTGYSDFEFAKSAVSLGVRAYLVKPVDEDELRQIIEEILAELEAKKNLDDFYLLSEFKARQAVLCRLLQPVEDKDSLHKELKFYGMDFKYNTFCVALLTRMNERAGQEHHIENYKTEYMQKGLKNVDVVLVDNKLIFICKGSRYGQIKEQLKKNNERLKREKNDGFYIAIGHDVTYWEDIYFSYECAKLLTEYMFLYKDKEVVCIDDLKITCESSDDNFANSVCNFIEIGDTDSIRNTFQNIKEFYKARIIKETEIKVQVIHNIVILFSMLEKKYYDKFKELPDLKEIIDNIIKSDSLENLIQTVYSYVLNIADKISITTTDNIVKRVMAYIERNYVNDLKLEDIAKIFSYNSAYLGKVFKKYTGYSFNEVLNYIRIENAKRLLLETDLKVYQISEQVGYSNADYFYNKFRKYVGVSPKEFIEQSKLKEG